MDNTFFFFLKNISFLATMETFLNAPKISLVKRISLPSVVELRSRALLKGTD